MKKTMLSLTAIIYPLIVGLLAATVAGCSGLQSQVTPAPSRGTEKIITMKASSFEFQPNNIRAVPGDTLVFIITNKSDSRHNFTIVDPRGRTIKTVDLPGKETVAVTVTLDEAGIYDFYCDKAFHAAFGMKGQVEAVSE